jgi:boron transporter
MESNGIAEKLRFLMTEERFIQRNEPLLRVPRKKILVYVGLQIIGVATSVAISQTIAAIGQSHPILPSHSLPSCALPLSG